MIDKTATPGLTLNDLHEVGQILYGERWQTPLASALGVTDRTIRYWLKGIDPNISHIRRIIVLLELNEYNSRCLVSRLREKADHIAARNDEENWKFDKNELEIRDTRTVLHIQTRTTVSFYEYDELPPLTENPMGIVANVGMFSVVALRRFQAAAWKLIWQLRYDSKNKP